MPNQTIRKTILDFAIIVLGALMYAFAVVVFIRPNDVPVGGVGGLAQILYHLFSLPMGVMTIVMNLPLFILSFRTLGRIFLFRTIVATVISGMAIDIISPFAGNLHLTDDKFLSLLYGGVLMGVGLGLVFSRGATTGGSDILAKLVTKRHGHISMGRVNLIINSVVIILAAVAYQNPESALYGALLQFITSTVVDTLLSGFDNALAALIVTKTPELVSDAIFEHMKRGCTGLDSHGMYSGKAQMTLLVAVRPHETTRLKNIVHQTDPKSFMIFIKAREVMGLGFKSFVN